MLVGNEIQEDEVWLRRPQIAQRHLHYALYVAQLVECRRANSQPRQVVIAHLASLDEYELDNALIRSAFWAQVTEKLAGVQLLREQRQAVLSQIAARVPQPSARERAGHAMVRQRRAVQPSERLYWMRSPAGWRLARRRRPAPERKAG